MMKFRRYWQISLLMFFTTSLCAQPLVIAHRGFWKTNGSAQNSITSLTKADSIGCYGSELDLWITTDGVVMVNHDHSYHGVAIESSSSQEVQKLVLANGEKMPTFESYLKAAKKMKTRLIVEIKTHTDIARQNLCIDEALKLVKKAKMTKRVTYIAFSLDAVKRLIASVPKHTEVYYLNGDLNPEELQKINCSGMDYQVGILKSHPEWIAQSHQLGQKVNAWTVDKDEDMEFCIQQKVDFITTNKPVDLQQLIEKSK